MVKKIYWPYVVLSYLGLFSLGVMDNSRGPFFPELLSHFNLSNTYGSFFFVVPSAFSFIGSALAPRLVRKFTVLRVQQMGVFILGLFFALMSLSPTFEIVLGAMAMYGVAFGVLAVTQHVIIQEGSQESDWRQLFSGLHSMYALASLAVPVAVSFMISLGWTWRNGFLLISGAGFLVSLGSLLIKPLPNTPLPPPDSKGFKWSYFYMGAAISLYIVGELVVSTRLVQFLRDAHGLSADSAPLYLSLFFIFLLIGRLGFSFKKYSLSNRQVILSCLFSSAISCYLGLLVSPYFLVLSGLFMGPVFAVNMNYVAEVFEKESSLAIASVMAYSAFYILSMHFGVGYLTDLLGIKKALYVGPLCLTISFVLILIRPKVFRYFA